jgi:hypothetical protein
MAIFAFKRPSLQAFFQDNKKIKKPYSLPTGWLKFEKRKNNRMDRICRIRKNNLQILPILFF